MPRSLSAADPDLTFRAVADPTRREIIGLLARESHGLTLTQLSAHFDVSRQAVTKHVHVLREAGLIRIQPRGRERRCTADLRRLEQIHEWVGAYQRFWTQKLEALGDHLDRKSS